MRLFYDYLVTGMVMALLTAVVLLVTDEPNLPQRLCDSLFINSGPCKLSSYTVSHVEWSADSQQLMVQARGGDSSMVCLSLHQLKGSGAVPPWADALRGTIAHARFSPNGTSVVVATTTGTLWWIDVETSAATELSKMPQSPFMTMAISHDGSLIAAATSEGDVYLFEPRRGKTTLLAQQQQHRAIGHLQFSNDARRLLSSATDGSLSIWDAETKMVLHEVVGRNQWNRSAAVFMPDGKRVMSLCNSDLIEIWDIDSKAVQWAGGEGTFGTSGITTIDICPKGRIAAWGGLDHRVTIWDLENQRLIREIRHPSLVFRVHLSPDGTRLAVAGREQLVRVYDVMSGRELHRIDVRDIEGTDART